MGFFDIFKPSGSTVKGTLEGVGTLAKDIRAAVTGDISAEKKAEIELRAREIESQILKAQTEINIEEAKSSNLFVAGWRPFIGWVCGIALLLNFIIKPLADMIFVFMLPGTTMPSIDINSLYPIVLGMLGLAITRSVDKKNRVQGEH